MRFPFPGLLAGALLLAAPALPAQPLGLRNEAALARAFALPGLGETTLAPTRASVRLSFDIASEFVDESRADEVLLLDGETHRYALRVRRALGAHADWNLEIPVLHVGGGFMDAIIENWHDAFGLPNGGREDAPRDRYRYHYRRDGVVRFDTGDAGTALGDVLLGAGYALRDGLVLRGQLKLPTGDEDRLAGGNAGAAVWLDGALPFAAGAPWSGFVAAGLSANEEGEVLPDSQETLVPFGGIGLELRLLPSLAVLTQLYAHAPLYGDSDLAAFERPGVQFALGGRWCPGPGQRCVELSFQEDVAVAASPDFSLRLALLLR